jgi:asparagine synthase (glutamine-hydrolysing)
MTDAIVHRGPDGEGHWCEEAFGLGHRRLAIIDLSPAGHQPMISTNNRYVISYNGEVYNFQELRIELEAIGYWFHSKTDSEVVLNAFAEWGVESLRKFNGMFAFAIWDRKKRVLTLARDRYGIKPLYYSVQNNTLIFGSEIKALMQHPEFRVELDKEALLEYFTFQNLFTDRSLHKGVKLLAAGHYLKVSFDSKQELKPIQYWDYNFQEPDQPLRQEEYIEELDRLMVQAVNRQIVSDVEVGSYLSGGMDSGTLTALAARQIPFLRSFTVGFDLSSASGLELAFDERAKAEQMSALFKTEHYEMVLKSGDMERCISDLAWHLEDPRVGQCYPNWYAAKLASKFGKVVLSGTGGDELFGGYPWRYYRAVVNNDFEDYVDKYYQFWSRLIPNSLIEKVFSKIKREVSNVWTRDIMRSVFKIHAEQLTTSEDYINHSLYFEAKTFLHGLFVVEDKLSMAHSLESRVPFMDNDLVDFAMRVPVAQKLGNLREVIRIDENDLAKRQKYYQKTKDGKLLLRKAMERYVPKDVSSREKQGFSSPDASWFKGESIDYVKATLLNRNARIYDYMDPLAVHELINDHLSGTKNRRLLIWSLLYVEAWMKRFL